MKTHNLLIIILPIVIISGSLIGIAYFSSNSFPIAKGQHSLTPDQSLFITSVTKGPNTTHGIELIINTTFFSRTSFAMYGSPYLSPCFSSVKLINEPNWVLNAFMIYFCPLISNNKTTYGPGTYNSSYTVYLVPLNGKTNVPFPPELNFQVSTFKNEYTSPIYTAKF